MNFKNITLSLENCPGNIHLTYGIHDRKFFHPISSSSLPLFYYNNYHLLTIHMKTKYQVIRNQLSSYLIDTGEFEYTNPLWYDVKSQQK